MNIKTNLPYPSDNYVELLKDFYADINGKESFDQVKEWQFEKWSATVHCTRGKILEKGGFARVNLLGGLVNKRPADISLFQTLAYPANPRVPGLIIMANMNASEAMGSILTFLRKRMCLYLMTLLKLSCQYIKSIIAMKASEIPQDEDFEYRNKSRARLIEWIILEDYGTRVARENGVLSEAIEAYGFPPVIQY